ncbi:MAG TPA: TRAP transporter large permease subunit, partial [Rubrivivax sp.]|nr:TRAP transporter large permease subunit [Rubrivivax sp.]
MIVAFMFLGLVALILLNVPIAVSLGIVAMAAMVHSGGFDALLNSAIVMFTGATSFPLLAIPLFILAG